MKKFHFVTPLVLLTTLSACFDPLTVKNRAPVAQDANFEAYGGEVFSGTLRGEDVDGDALTFLLMSPATQGLVHIKDSRSGLFEYLVDQDAQVEDEFLFVVSDGKSRSLPARVRFTLRSRPNPDPGTNPVADAMDLTVEVGASITRTLTGRDPGGAALSFLAIELPTKGDLTLNYTTGSFTYRARANAQGTDSFRFKVHNGSRFSEPARVTLRLRGTPTPNRPPVARAGAFTVAAAATYEGNLTGEDPDGDPLTFEITEMPTKGALTLRNNQTGAFRFVADSNASGMAQFKFRVSDARLQSEPAVVQITISTNPPARNFCTDIRPITQAFCIQCHSASNKSGGLALDVYHQQDFAGGSLAERWNRVLARLNAQTMPPAGMARPTAAQVAVLSEWISQGRQEGTSGCVQPSPSPTPPPVCSQPVSPGPVRVWKLSNAQYNNTVRDILGDTSRPADEFARETSGSGFLNPSDSFVGSANADKYMQAAESLAESVVNNRPATLHSCLPAGFANESCASSVVSAFGKRAFRRPLSSAEQTSYLDLYRAGKAASDGRLGIRYVVEAMLQAPAFLYRTELGAGTVSGNRIQLTSYENASQLSYLIWNSTPDQLLLEAADRDELRDSAKVQLQVTRMLADSKARDAIWDFFEQVFELNDILTNEKNTTVYPGLTPALRRDFINETRALVQYIVFDGAGTLDEFFTASYTFLNRSLATHYGISGGPTGTGLVKTNLNNQRKGILTTAAFLGAHGSSKTSNPVKRGLLLRTKLFCDAIPPPPNLPGAGNPPPEDPGLTTRDRFAVHGERAECWSCHKIIDPLGFGFERYDGIGAYRERENGYTVNSRGEITEADVSGTYDGALELSQKLAQSQDIAQCVSRHYFHFAQGRSEAAGDCQVIADMQARFQSSGTNIISLIRSITESPTFFQRTRN